MRLYIIAVGYGRATHEGALTQNFVDRAALMGKQMGVSAVICEEIAVSRDRDVRKRLADEAERLTKRVPEGAHIIRLDAKGKGMTSEEFAQMLGALRDVGTKALAFVIGGPDGLASLPGKRAGRSLAFGLQTWPHLLVRAMLSEQIYRSLTILSNHPYHRG